MLGSVKQTGLDRITFEDDGSIKFRRADRSVLFEMKDDGQNQCGILNVSGTLRALDTLQAQFVMFMNGGTPLGNLKWNESTGKLEIWSYDNTTVLKTFSPDA